MKPTIEDIETIIRSHLTDWAIDYIAATDGIKVTELEELSESGPLTDLLDVICNPMMVAIKKALQEGAND